MLTGFALPNIKPKSKTCITFAALAPDIKKKEAPVTGASFDPLARPDGRSDVQRVIGL